MPASLASSTTYWIKGLSTMVSISFGIALVAGRTRVPRPATGKTALRIFMGAVGMGSSEGLPLVAGFWTTHKGGRCEWFPPSPGGGGQGSRVKLPDVNALETAGGPP